MASSPPAFTAQTDGPARPWTVFSPLGLTLLCLVALGVYLRFSSFSFPATFLFDEHHFVENARHYIRHERDLNDHPPLGKIVIAVFIRLLGDNPAGWRGAALITGMLTMGLGGLAGARLFRSQLAGFIAIALLGADGFCISYSRAALLDGFLAMSVVAALLLSTFRTTWLTAVLAGVLAGVAMNIKFSGLGVLPPLVVGICLSPLTLQRKLLIASLVVTSTFGTYIALYAYGLYEARSPWGVSDVFLDTARLLAHHAELTDMKNPSTSGWITWGLPRRPILLGFTRGIEGVRALTSLGNVAIWWPSVVLGVLACAAIVWEGMKQTLRPRSQPAGGGIDVPAFVAARGRAVVLVLAGAGGYLAPWVFTHRDSYIYHFLPVYVCLIILLSGYLSWVHEVNGLGVLLFALLVLIVAAFYAPVWSMMPLSEGGFRWRLFLETWR